MHPLSMNCSSPLRLDFGPLCCDTTTEEAFQGTSREDSNGAGEGAIGHITVFLRRQALGAIGGRSDALVDLGRSVHLARTMATRLCLYERASQMFDIEASEELAQESRATVQRICRGSVRRRRPEFV
jgi:hypothetical protein